MSKKKKTPLEEMIKERYSDPDVAARVLKSIADNRTEERIENGELTLPSEDDATAFHQSELRKEAQQ